MSWSEAKSLDESLLSLDSFFFSPPRIAEVLSGGLTNRCWRIHSHSGVSYVWRPISHYSYQFGISRTRENQVLQALSHSHFAPSPVLLNDSGLLVEWFDAIEDAPPLNEYELVDIIHTIHSIDTQGKSFPFFSFTLAIDGYWHKLKSDIKADYEALYKRWRELPTIRPVQPTLCHLDLGEHNIVRTQQGIKVIDWEYAGVADPRMDLAMTIDLAEVEASNFITTYCHLRGIDDVECWIDGVNHWRSHNQMMAMLWYLLGYQMKQDEHYLKQALCLKGILEQQ